MSDTEYQIFNWMHFIWLSGDQIAEQAVHNIDTMNWIMGGPPDRHCSGGRFTRPEGSEMWDNVEVIAASIPVTACSRSCVVKSPGLQAITATIYGTKDLHDLWWHQRRHHRP